TRTPVPRQPSSAAAQREGVPDHVEQRVRQDRFDQVAVGAGAARALSILLAREARDDEDRCRCVDPFAQRVNELGRLEACLAKCDVGDDDVRSEFVDEPERFLGSFCGGDSQPVLSPVVGGDLARLVAADVQNPAHALTVMRKGSMFSSACLITRDDRGDLDSDRPARLLSMSCRSAPACSGQEFTFRRAVSPDLQRGRYAEERSADTYSELLWG